MTTRQPMFVRGDLDGFFGLMVDNLVHVLLIIALTRELLHFPDALVFQRILPTRSARSARGRQASSRAFSRAASKRSARSQAPG